jgi:hypothetical protein
MPSRASRRALGREVNPVPVLFATAAFLGAFLLFCVQPMIAKMVLPHFGGAPAVWTTCMVFFQSALLAGYLYAHTACAWLGTRRQAFMQVGLLALPFAVLPFAIPASTESSSYPAPELLVLLLATIGLPFFVVSTTAPLLQRWLAATSHKRARDPYFLYAASNAGSLLGLVAYVALIEPNLSLRWQSWLWTVGYGILAALTIACVLVHLRHGRLTEAAAPAERIGMRERFTWVALAFAPSSLMLGVTTYLTTDIAPVPLIWVLPLILYLLSFILAFAGVPPWVKRNCERLLAPSIVASLALWILPGAVPLWATFCVHLATFFIAASCCHLELAERRPEPRSLTDFYLCVSVGGALGGVFNALVAPLIFSWVAEYPLVLALLPTLIPAVWRPQKIAQHYRRATALLNVLFPLLLGVVTYAVPRMWASVFPKPLLLVPLASCLFFARQPLRFALALAAIAVVVADLQDSGKNVIERRRNFFGVLRVSADFPTGMNSLAHGNTLHGMQRRSSERSVRRIPLLYYFPTGPIGQVFEAYHRTPVLQRVAVVGLGAGSLAGYGMTGQEFTFFEIDPAVERIARDRRYFHFLEDCRARWRIVEGDARISLGREPDHAFGLIVLDAFSGDAIPVHMLTREALEIYLAKLDEGGLIAFHISNNYVDLEPVAAELQRNAGLAGLALHELTVPPSDSSQGRMPSHWVVLARRQGDLAPLASRPGWRIPSTHGRRVSLWTDNHSDLFSLLRWR